MKKFGLIGFPLGHSFSKKYFTEKFQKEGFSDYVYENYPLAEISDVLALIKNEPFLVGLNVTIPYKEKILAYLDEIDAEASKIGAVNTVKISRSSQKLHLQGFNTDCTGFENPLIEVLKPWHTSALVLGTGGASKAVVYVLSKHNIKYHFVSRNPKDLNTLCYQDLTFDIIQENKIIINTSPLGMHPHIETSPDIPYQFITEDHILYDLVYNPELTNFLRFGKEKKATIINGLPMLYGQAEKAWKIWNA